MRTLVIFFLAALANFVSPLTASAAELQDCSDCPLLVVVPAGVFPRALSPNDPPTEVHVGAFALGKFEVTIAEFAAFVANTGHEIEPGCQAYTSTGGRLEPAMTWEHPGFSMSQTMPALCVSWGDALAFADWLSSQTGERYRLPTEAEWDYAARAGAVSDVSYFFRAGLEANQANCPDCTGFDVMGRDELLKAVPAGTFVANGFGLHDMFGNAAEWVLDCYNPSYAGAPTDGTARLEGDCDRRIVRGGAWYTIWAELAGFREGEDLDFRNNGIGFRVARDLD
ncbi:MAG: formylglycine-generating enzyme family protein [Alphaproteobacteria bacterium]